MRAQGWVIDNDDARNKDGVIRWTILPPAEPEKPGKSSPPDPLTPPGADNDWSDGLRKGGEDDWGDDWGDEDDNPPDPHDPPNDTPLTSQDGLAGMAGQKYTPSQVGNERTKVPRCACGTELQSKESIRRGNCTRCFLTAKRADQ